MKLIYKIYKYFCIIDEAILPPPIKQKIRKKFKPNN